MAIAELLVFCAKGADITDYFNYGFNEDTWTKYCEKQRRLRIDNNANKSGGNLIFVSVVFCNSFILESDCGEVILLLLIDLFVFCSFNVNRRAI